MFLSFLPHNVHLGARSPQPLSPRYWADYEKEHRDNSIRMALLRVARRWVLHFLLLSSPFVWPLK